MEKNLRLFDCIEHQIQLGAIPDMLAVKENSRWKKYSTADVKNTTLRLAAGLLREGVSRHDNTVESRDKIAILSKNRPEWIMLDMAVQMIGGILTPVYPTINVNELEFILMDAAVKWVFVNDEELYLKVNSLKNKLPELQEIFAFEHVTNARHWKELLKNPDPYKIDEAQRIAETIRPEEVATIIYTSGTTGTPKGVMLTHRNIGSNVMASMECFPPGDQLRALSFLPLNHIFERMVTYLYLFKRTSIYYAESLDTIGVDLKEVQPDLFTTVPRLLEKVYDQIMLKGKELTGMKRKLFFWAHGLAEKYNINRALPMHYRMQLALANKFVFRKWREALGNRVMCIVTGGAACQVRLIRIFTAAGIPIMEGYGLTESSPVICVNRYDVKERMIGTVGPTIPGVEVKIAEDGEIVCSGPNVMAGYYKRPDLTAEVIRDGWLLTGDIGEMVKGRFVKITDRKKELFKTSGGKYVAPLSIESRLKESPYVEQAMVVGAERKYTGALIIPSFPNLLEWCRENGIMETQPERLVHEPKVQEFYRELVDSFNKFFNQVEQVKKFELLARDWSVETGELTPKLSLKRKVIMEKYRDAIDRIYAE